MNHYSVQMVDVIIAGVALLSALMGLMRGLAKEILSIFSWIAALIAGLYAYEPLYPFWMRTVDNSIIAYILAFGCVFIGVLATCLILTGRVAAAVENGALGGLDRTLGFGFGAVRGFVIVCLMYLIFLNVNDKNTVLPEWLASSRALPLVEEGAQILVSILPRTIQKTVYVPEDSTLRTPKRDSESTLDRLRRKTEKPLKSEKELPAESSSKSIHIPTKQSIKTHDQQKDTKNFDKLIETIQ